MRFDLVCHPTTPANRVRGVHVAWAAKDDDDVCLTFSVAGAEHVLWPGQRSPERQDELWRTTCFEMFWRGVGADTYVEFNLAPSLAWAAYQFDGYRSGMETLALAVAPRIARTLTGIEADVDLSDVLAGPARVGLSAVIEETDGTKSYWALAHPPGAPDFHHDACFALQVPALGAP